MNDKQIERLIKQSERSVFYRTWNVPICLWGVSATTPLVSIPLYAPQLGCMLGGFFAFCSVVSSRQTAIMWRAYKQSRAVSLWKVAAWNEQFFPDPAPPTKILRGELTEFYRADQSAEVLPLAQGLRLLSVYELQQQRQELIAKRIIQLHALRDKLVRTATQLETLGESRPDTTGSVHKAQSELAALERLVDESLASCKRLEVIVVSTQKALQVRQLHHELTRLQSDITSTISQPLMEPYPTNIEGQISREIETYLQLERETELHFRDL